MSVIGEVDSLWRYPVKSMRGEHLPEMFVGYPGVYGDRLFAFKSTAAPSGFPFLTARQAHVMLLYRPRFRYPEKALKPVNLTEAKRLSPLLKGLAADAADLAVDVETPSGEVLAIDDPRLLHELSSLAGEHRLLHLLRSERGLTDCFPVSLFSLQTLRQLGKEASIALDKRRFRSNLYLDLSAKTGFAENALVGRRLCIGDEVVISVVERDPRCQMITLDPDTGTPNREVLRRVARDHNGTAGIYGAVLREGMIRASDPVAMLG